MRPPGERSARATPATSVSIAPLDDAWSPVIDYSSGGWIIRASKGGNSDEPLLRLYAILGAAALIPACGGSGSSFPAPGLEALASGTAVGLNGILLVFFSLPRLAPSRSAGGHRSCGGREPGRDRLSARGRRALRGRGQRHESSIVLGQSEHGCRDGPGRRPLRPIRRVLGTESISTPPSIGSASSTPPTGISA